LSGNNGARKRLILASTSPYRRELLNRLGLPFDTAAPGIDETPRPGESPAELAGRLARSKALAVTDDAVVIGSDQVAALDGKPLGKPGSHARALEQLESFQGREVLFHTAVCVQEHHGRTLQEHVDVTRVRFRRLPGPALDRYLRLEPAYDCAGGFKSEGLGVALFEAIESSDPTALIGLPLIWLAAALREAGLDPLAPDG
jgi:septum formation protein